MQLTPDEWSQYFIKPHFQRSAWRFEAQPTYTIPREQERIELWRSGVPEPADHNKVWRDRVRWHVSEGRSVSRVRIVRPPLTEYQRYSFEWSIPGNTQAGEDLRILDLNDHPDLEPLPKPDWWMFDDQVVVRLDFNDDGTLAGYELVNESDVDGYRQLRDRVSGLAVPFAQYVADHRS